MLRRSASAVDEAIQKVPGIGDDEFDRIEVPPPPKEIGEKFQKLIDTLNTQTTKESCILNYGGLPDLQGYSIEFLPRTEPGPKFIVQLRSPDGRIVRGFTDYVNQQLCVDGGEIYGTDLVLFGGQVQEHGTLPPIADLKNKEIKVNTEKIKNLNPPTVELYRQGQVSLGLGARLAGATLSEFLDLLGEHGVDLNVTLDDIKKQVETADRILNT